MESYLVLLLNVLTASVAEGPSEATLALKTAKRGEKNEPV